MAGPDAPLTRPHTSYRPHHNYLLPKGEDRHYQQQYADMYFARLAQLKPAVEQIAAEAFDNIEVAGEPCRRVDRVLDVRQGELCWVVGTIYMEMPLKPNVLEDIGKEHWIAAPPSRVKYDSAVGLAVEGEKGAHSGAQGGVGTQMMLEDESGRLRLTGGFLRGCLLVTGAIVAVVGTENKDGDFEVLDLRVPDLPRQPPRWEREDSEAALTKTKQQDPPHPSKVAILSGLSISGDEGDTLPLDLLLEYLLGESGTPADQASAAQITRLILAGNSLSHASPIPSREDIATAKKSLPGATRKYGYDAAAYNAAPTDRLDTWLATLLPTLPITLLPGEHDPTSTALPQQPIHAAMFPHSRAYMNPPSSSNHPTPWFSPTTNPTAFSLSGWSFLGTAGQPVNDIAKYLPSDHRLEMIEAMLRWRLIAPTAPDTLWCYPFQDGDQFVLKECPHVVFVGDQPAFATEFLEGPAGQRVRVVAVPSFRETGEVVLLDLESLACEVLRFGVFEGEQR
ncbi:hypothetical protein EJ03DRAFT_346565 [Teratosphaeria nubilosa]|uniref:DNA-directed DNA polymerase n=1 Tax=Teratosphaeria nubilosa TaxID=161662 RepID=A0A6G1KTD4_9PEZI|nr:hypothetical protein EJ03DRAFT_346565 [Teratosphaeria nubilosa]